MALGQSAGRQKSRRRLFLVARCDGRPVAWPAPTHGPKHARPWRTAAECIDWGIPCRSIFGRGKPLCANTLARIGRGMRRFVLEAARPFVVPMTRNNRPTGVDEPLQTVTTQTNRFTLCVPRLMPAAALDDAGADDAGAADAVLAIPTLVQSGYGERKGQAPRVPGLHKPLGTIVAQGQKHRLVAAYLAKHYGGKGTPGISCASPLGTVTTKDHHAVVEAELMPADAAREAPGGGQAEPRRRAAARRGAKRVYAFLRKYAGLGGGIAAGRDLFAAAGTACVRDGQVILQVGGAEYVIVDIATRLFEPRELYRGQGFPDSYVIDVECDGKPLSKAAQIRMCGNAVSPYHAGAVLAANLCPGVLRGAVTGLGSAGGPGAVADAQLDLLDAAA